MSNLPRAHTHPTTRPLTSLSSLPQHRSLTAASSPTYSYTPSSSSSPNHSPRSPRSPRLRAIPRSSLTSPLREVKEDPFGASGFFPLAGASGGEGEFGWVRAQDGDEVLQDGEDTEEQRLDGEEELGVDECVRRVLDAEDRLGVLGLTSINLQLPSLSHTPTSASPPTPPRLPPPAYAPAYAPHTLTDPSHQPHMHDHGPETDESLHESFAARTRAVSYPDLVMLAARKRPANEGAPVAGMTAGPRTAGSKARSLASAQPQARAQPRTGRTPRQRTHTELVYTRRETSVERRAGWEEKLTGTEVGGLFFDNGAEAAGKEGNGGGVKGVPEAREGWRVWALERAARAAGLD